MDEAARYRAQIAAREDEIEKRDQIIASLEVEVTRLRAQWDEIYRAGQRSVLAVVPERAGRGRRVTLRVIQGGMGAGIAAAVLGAARQVLGAHRAAAAVVATSMVAAAGAAAPALLLPGPGPVPAVTAGPAVSAVPYSPARREHPRDRRGAVVPRSGTPAGSGPGSASPPVPPGASHGTKAAGSPSPVPSPTSSPSPSPSPSPTSSPSSSPAPVISVTATVSVAAPSPSQCLITVLGLCV